MTELSDSTRLLSLIVHELRAPMTVATGYVSMLRRETAGPLTQQQQNLIADVDKACSRLTELLANISEIVNLEERRMTFNRGTIELNPLLESIASDLAAGRVGTIKIQFVGDLQPVSVVADALRLRRALACLFAVALREAKEDLAVSRTMTDLDGKRTIVLTLGSAQALETVSAAAAERTTFDEWRSGHGLGLPVARRVIEAHGGRVWTASRLSRSVTAVALPLE
ncbi:MAG: HAMP domain-containing histidine kinase [Acidobacteria bacterium]|nr:HAMP domain-containing histidine kinase [Acidobacteriota bacterium]